MNSDLLAKWTVIVTNLAVVVGLVFVGLEFRDNTRAIEAERIDGLVQGSATVESLTVENADLAEIIYRTAANPESLTGSELDRAQHWLMMHYGQFQRTTLAHQAGLIPDDIYELQKAGLGFVFSSDIGLEVIALMRASNLADTSWKVINESAERARAYCLNPNNSCVARYEALRRSKGS